MSSVNINEIISAIVSSIPPESDKHKKLNKDHLPSSVNVAQYGVELSDASDADAYSPYCAKTLGKWGHASGYISGAVNAVLTHASLHNGKGKRAVVIGDDSVDAKQILHLLLNDSYTITYIPRGTPADSVVADVVVCFAPCDDLRVPAHGLIFECVEEVLKNYGGDCPVVSYSDLSRVADAAMAKACAEHSRD